MRNRTLIVYLSYFVILAVIIGFIIVAPQSKPSTSHKTPVQHRPPATAAKPKPKPAPAASTPDDNSAGTGALANSGPGDTAGVFVVTTIASAAAYRRLLIRKARQSA